MVKLTAQQMKALELATDAPPRVADPTTGAMAVLLKSADFEWMRGLLGDEPEAEHLTDPRTQETYALVPCERYERFKAFFEEDPISLEEQKRLLRAAGLRAGWDDSAFDVYDDLASKETK